MHAISKPSQICFPMENHNYILKISRLLSSTLSSCHLRTLPDVAESSISVPKSSNHSIASHDGNDHSALLMKPKKNSYPPPKFISFLPSNSDAEGRKCPPVTPTSVDQDSLEFQARNFQELNNHKKNCNVNVYSNQQSSSSNSGWFSSGDEKLPETDAFFSLSSCSGDSFRRRTCRRTRCDEIMNSIDELGEQSSFRSSLSSSSAHNTVAVIGASRRVPPPEPAKPPTKTRRKTAGKAPVKRTQLHAETELGFDHTSTQLYYNNQDRSFFSSHGRRRTAKPRRSPLMEESLAVEKKSRDPRGDFRASMVDMILEKQMFGAKDLEKLLICFLKLNAVCYHGIIFEVFSEICEALFSY